MDTSKRFVTGLIGWTVLLAGIVMTPYPGPGWATIFLGLAILARQYVWARKTLDATEGYYKAWMAWQKRQPLYIKAIFWLLTSLTVVITLWLLNGYGLMNDWFDLGLDWVRSPLFD